MTMLIVKKAINVPRPKSISTGNKVQSISIKRVPSVVAPKRNIMTSAFVRSTSIGCIKRMK